VAGPDETVWDGDADVRGAFPDQFMSLDRLLKRDKGFGEVTTGEIGALGSHKRPDETKHDLGGQHIRYYHIPYTHMSVRASSIFRQ